MMPVAGEDTVLDAATLKREAHMWTAVVEREDVPVLVHEQDRAVAAVHNKPTFGFQLFKTGRVYEIRGRAIHGRLIREVSASVPFGKDIPRMSIRSTDVSRNLAGEGSDVVAPNRSDYEPPPVPSVPGRHSAIHSHRLASIRAKHLRAAEIARSDGVGSA